MRGLGFGLGIWDLGFGVWSLCFLVAPVGSSEIFRSGVPCRRFFAMRKLLLIIRASIRVLWGLRALGAQAIQFALFVRTHDVSGNEMVVV